MPSNSKDRQLDYSEAAISFDLMAYEDMAWMERAGVLRVLQEETVTGLLKVVIPNLGKIRETIKGTTGQAFLVVGGTCNQLDRLARRVEPYSIDLANTLRHQASAVRESK